MKKHLTCILALLLSFSLFTACGKSRAEELMDKYTEIANAYSSQSGTIATTNDAKKVADFPSLGFELTDIASKLAKGEELTNEDLDSISAALDEINTKLSTITGGETE